jgi:Xaa-Pro aminopeptidase
MNLSGRLASLRKQLPSLGLEALLVTEPKNRRYLSGFTGSSGWLLVTEDSHVILTDGRYWDQVVKESQDADLFKFLASEHKSLAGALICLARERSLSGCLGLEISGMQLSIYRSLSEALKENDLEFKDVEGLVQEQREIKDEQEISLLRKAAEIADQALSKALGEFRPGLPEVELKALIEYNILKLGGESTSFSTIVASGPNGSYPHAGASQRIVRENELITVDFGAIYKGYCSDMTRTIWYGTLSDRDKLILGATREAQELALRAVTAGVEARALDQIARGHLESVDLAEYFVHSLGHGVGLDIHEEPGLRKTNEDALRAGQVVTIEPGVYIPGDTGCRVEDTVVVTSTKPDVLNRFPKQPLDADSPSALLA